MNPSVENLTVPALTPTMEEVLALRENLKNELVYAQNAIEDGYQPATVTLVKAVIQDRAASFVAMSLMNASSVEDAVKKVTRLLTSELDNDNGDIVAARVYNDALATLRSYRTERASK